MQLRKGVVETIIKIIMVLMGERRTIEEEKEGKVAK